MKSQPLSQFKVDPAQEDVNVVVPAKWLREMLADYQKAVNEVTHLNSVITQQGKILSSKDDRIQFLETTSLLVRLDVTC